MDYTSGEPSFSIPGAFPLEESYTSSDSDSESPSPSRPSQKRQRTLEFQLPEKRLQSDRFSFSRRGAIGSSREDPHIIDSDTESLCDPIDNLLAVEHIYDNEDLLTIPIPNRGYGTPTARRNGDSLNGEHLYETEDVFSIPMSTRDRRTPTARRNDGLLDLEDIYDPEDFLSPPISYRSRQRPTARKSDDLPDGEHIYETEDLCSIPISNKSQQTPTAHRNGNLLDTEHIYDNEDLPSTPLQGQGRRTPTARNRHIGRSLTSPNSPNDSSSSSVVSHGRSDEDYFRLILAANPNLGTDGMAKVTKILNTRLPSLGSTRSHGYVYVFWETPSETARPSLELADSLSDMMGRNNEPRLTAPDGRTISLRDALHPITSGPAHQSPSKQSPYSPPGMIQVKIGRTCDLKNRMKQLEKDCKKHITLLQWYGGEKGYPTWYEGDHPDWALMHEEPKMRFVQRVEHLVHASLQNYRIIKPCSSCNMEHIEWFEIPATPESFNTVASIIDLWTEWAQDRAEPLMSEHENRRRTV